MQGMLYISSLFPNEINKFNYTGEQNLMLDSIYHIICLK